MMKKTATFFSFLVLILFSLGVTVSAAEEQITGEIKVLNGAGEVVKTYELIINDREVNTEPTIQKALNYCRDNATDTDIHTILFPKGEYGVHTSLNVYSNTILDFSSSVVTRREYNGSVIRFGKSTDISCGYNGYRNITVKNAVLDMEEVGTSSIMRFAHASNVEISNITFKNTLDVQHLLTFGASEKVRIVDCRFLDMRITDKKKDYNCEALQIDILKEEYFTYPAYDGTQTRDVVISGCTFDNVPRGLGTHSGITGYYFDGISIRNNVFRNITGYAVKVVGYINSEISGNTITDCGSGICCATVPNSDLVNFYAPMAGAQIIKKLNVKISGNNISLKSKGFDNNAYGIRVHGENIVKYKDADGKTFSADCRISGVTVENNIINSAVSHIAAFGIHIDGAVGSTAGYESDVRVINNKVTFTNPNASSNYIYGIKVESSDNIFIRGNTVTDTKNGTKNMHSGIITDLSKGIIIEGNTVTNAKSYGIRLATTKNSAVTFNTVSATGSNAVYIYNNCSGVSVSSNKISNCLGYGISVYNSSVIEVNTNTVSKAGGYGITLRNATVANVSYNTVTSGTTGINLNSATVTKVTGNAITSPTAYGIYSVSSKVETLKSNVITGCKGKGISLNSSTVTVLSHNKINKSGSNGIYVNKSTVTDLKSNTVTGSKVTALYVTGSGVSNLTSNKIESSGGHGIYFVSSKTDKLKSNKLYSTSKYSIYLDDSTAKVLSSNKIFNGKKAGIYISGASKVTTLSSNHVSGGKGTGIYLTGTANVTTIYKNKIDVVSSKIDGIAVKGKAKTGKIKNNSINAKASEGSKSLKVSCRYGIRINSASCKVTHIYSNTVKYCEKSGVYVAKINKKAKVRITKNTVAKAMYGVSYLKDRATVKDNTIRKYSKAETRVIKAK